MALVWNADPLPCLLRCASMRPVRDGLARFGNDGWLWSLAAPRHCRPLARQTHGAEAVKQDAFKIGYKDGTDAIGRVGSPAQARADDDEGAERPKLPVC